MQGIEIDFVVPDSLAALKLYESIFDVERVHVSNLPKGENEAIFSINGLQFHLLDENEKFHLYAPEPGHPVTMWLNVTVLNIDDAYKRAIQAGCIEIQPVVVLTGYGVSNASFMDPFGYHWMLHQIHDVVSYEKRLRLMDE